MHPSSSLPKAPIQKGDVGSDLRAPQEDMSVQESRAWCAELERRLAAHSGALRRANTLLKAELESRRRRERELGEQRKQLIYLARKVLLGELCGAIAHELNQPLAVILANAQAAQRSLARAPAEPGPLCDILDDIVDADRHAAGVIQRLRALYLNGEAECAPLDLNELVRATLRLAAGMVSEHAVSVRLQLAARLPRVRGDRVQLQQVLLNLIVNACEAMRATPAGARQLTISTGAAGGVVELKVADHGPGVPHGLLPRIFEPFFTTRAHGLGFGLSVSRAIVQAHGGRIEAANEGEGGAVFRVTLPAYKEGTT